MGWAMRIALLTAPALAVLFLAPPVVAAHRQHTGVQFTHRAGAEPGKKKEIANAKEYLRKWPDILRDAFLAECYELLFTDDGSLPYKDGGKMHNWPGEIAPSRDVSNVAKFIASDGKPHLWRFEGLDIKAGKPDLNQQWRDVKNTIAKYGDKAVMDSFAKEIADLKLKFANRNKSAADIQREKARQRHAAKNVSKEADSILKGMQNKLDAASRQAFLACLADGVSVQDALSHTYVNPDGELCFVYEDLLSGCCVEEFLQLLQKASATEGTGAAVLDKFDKKVAALKKSKGMRSLLLQATQKQYEADLALMEAKQMNSSTAESGDSVARSVAALIDNEKDPLCRAALVAIATEKLTPGDLFVQAVFDDESIPHSCYDVLSHADMLDKAADLMVKVHACAGPRYDMAEKYDAEVQARQSAGQKRDGLIQVALKTHEAQEARKHLKKVRND